MNTEKEELLRGNKIEILEMLLKCIDRQLVLSWKICVENKLFQMTFFNVSRFRISETSAPFEIHGFEIINHSQNGWEKDSTYEICDFEEDRISFFCKWFKLDEK